MRIGFVVNDIATEQPIYSTTRLAMSAAARGHDVHVMGLRDFGYEPDGSLSAITATASQGKRYRSLDRYLEDVQSATRARTELDDFDVLMLRADPAAEAADTAWASTAGLAFGRMAAEAGVLVVNDPRSLADAMSKAYFQQFPEVVRPRTLITRDEDRVREFIDELGGRAVLKPLQGSGGSGVFLVDLKRERNIAQIVEAIARDGYVVAQEYLPAAKEGDVRMFVMNGRPLEIDGVHAAFRRRPNEAEVRSNMSAGGKAEPAKVTDQMLRLVDAVRPKLLTDGMFLVGLDIAGDKLMEVNVFSPGGLGSCAALYGIDFASAVIDDLERKTGMRAHYGSELPNVQLATA
ncbi:glutathione synthase [Microbacterium trichothecenolyticum]|uniref:glutathione synthetase n=1 Tax=Microbacterium trichothecenolyticum TaxID=69370 RepID=UPI00285D70A2|nr:glutathione synthetase [Microbacterium trichothecenolyticum]MDR7186801.1 glutathione synthase [Microbacterium trichothecenolyticum]